MMEDFFSEEIVEQKAKVANGTLEVLRAKNVLRQGVRVFGADGRVQSASAVGALSKGVLFEQAKANGAAAIGGVGIPSGRSREKFSYLRPVSQSSVASRATLLVEEAHHYLVSRLPHFSINGYALSQRVKTVYENWLGANLSLERDSDQLVFEFRRKGSPNIADHFFGMFSFDPISCEISLGWTADFLSSFDRSAKLESGKHKVLWCPDGPLLRKISESLRVDKVKEGVALFGKRMGEKVFSEKFGMVDLRWAPERGVLKPFDYEGSLAMGKALPLVEKGVLKNTISDLKHEKKYGKSSSANGFRTYNGSVQLEFAGLRLESGEKSFREILAAESDPVVIITTAFGGDVTAEGHFSTPVQGAYLWRKGEIEGRLPNFSLSGTLLDFFGSDLLAVAKDGPEGLCSEPYVLSRANLLVH